jgi:hypothetical protein
MDSDSAQAIITIVILLIVLAFFFIPFGLFFVYVFFQNSKRKKIRERMLATHQQLLAGRPWLPVRYASEPRFRSWFKIFPWEGAGILVLAPGSVLFLGETNSGVPVNIQFAPANARINWIGKTPFPNGAVSWFDFTMASEKHYFSSETGAFIFGSNKSTRNIFEEANRSFAGQPPGA